MSERGPAATRQNLLATTRRLERVTRGVGLLRRKREALVSELFRLARPAAALRRSISERADAAWPALLGVLTGEGYAGARSIGWPARELTAEIRAGQVWGIAVGEILQRSTVPRTLAARGTPPGATSTTAIVAADAFEALTDVLLEAAGREALLRRLGEALARTSRQVNTLELRIGPQLGAAQLTIRRTLDEREREEQVRLQRLRHRQAPVSAASAPAGSASAQASPPPAHPR